MFFKKKYIGFLYDKNLSGRVYYTKRETAGFFIGECMPVSFSENAAYCFFRQGYGMIPLSVANGFGRNC